MLKFNPYKYAFGVIIKNFDSIQGWEWDYLSGKYEGVEPHGIKNEVWAEVIEALLSMSED